MEPNKSLDEAKAKLVEAELAYEKAKQLAEILNSPTPLAKIRQKVIDYHNKMNALANLPGSPMKNSKSTEFLQFYIDQDALSRLTKMGALPNCEQLVVFFGVHVMDDGNEKNTACFLAADKDGNLLPEHTKSAGGHVPGEETWPPPPPNQKERANCFTLESDVLTVAKYFSAT